MAKRNNASLRLLLIPALPPHSGGVRRKGGFTLIELSIVLVIIGLIVGGVLVGRNLIHSAVLNKLGSQIQSYDIAVNSFVLKYDCLPGDCPYATEMFGTSSDGCPTASYNTHTSGTCDGDGDGKLDSGLLSTEQDEGLRLWEMLSQAQLIPGNYTSAGRPSWAFGTAGTIYPGLPSSLTHNATNSGIRAYAAEEPLFVPPMMTKHIFVIGLTDQGYSNSKAALAPMDARWYDSKFDDGLPLSGNIKGAMYNNGYVDIYSDCFDGTEYLPSEEYHFTDSTDGVGCALFIGTSF